MPASTSDVITFDQNWHHQNSSSEGGKLLSNDNQIRVIGSMKPEIYTKMLRNLSEKLAAEFPATALSYFAIVKIARVDDAFSEIFELEASPVEAKKKHRKKGKPKKPQTIKKNRKA